MKKIVCLLAVLTLLSVVLCGLSLAEEETPIKKLTITDKNVILAPNTRYQLSLTVDPENASTEGLIWTSSNEKVATVDEKGLVTGVKKGSAQITVKASGGSKAKAVINVKVQEYDLVFTSRDPQKVQYSYGTGRFNISGSVKNGKVSIPSINEYVMASVIGGKIEKDVDVTPISAGEDVITIKVNKKKFTYKAYVSQEVFSAPDIAPINDNEDIVLLAFDSFSKTKSSEVVQEDSVYKLKTLASKDPGIDSNAISFKWKTPYDASIYSKLVFYIKDLQGSNTHRVTFIDGKGKNHSQWIETRSEYCQWKRIEVLLNDYSEIDLSAIKEIRIGEWNEGIYLFDRIGFINK